MKDLVKRSPALLLIYRFLNEAVDVRKLLGFPGGVFSYFRSLFRFRKLHGSPLPPLRLFPMVHDRTSTTALDPHYFYQGWWAFRHVVASRGAAHYDVGSQIDFIRYLSAVVPVTFIDIRPIVLPLPNLTCVEGSILASGCATGSLPSISCLHVIEHIGLGRYGDPLDPQGSQKAATELARILAPGGRLYLSTPIGKPRLEFNAHWIRSPDQVVALFPGLHLLEFSVVDDSGRFIERTDSAPYSSARYACGMFVFGKPDSAGHGPQ